MCPTRAKKTQSSKTHFAEDQTKNKLLMRVWNRHWTFQSRADHICWDKNRGGLIEDTLDKVSSEMIPLALLQSAKRNKLSRYWYISTTWIGRTLLKFKVRIPVSRECGFGSRASKMPLVIELHVIKACAQEKLHFAGASGTMYGFRCRYMKERS